MKDSCILIRKTTATGVEFKWMVKMMAFLLFSEDFWESVINRGVSFLLTDWQSGITWALHKVDRACFLVLASTDSCPLPQCQTDHLVKGVLNSTRFNGSRQKPLMDQGKKTLNGSRQKTLNGSKQKELCLMGMFDFGGYIVG